MNYRQVISAAVEAGESILKIYNQNFAHYEKSDSSPLTEADLAAHNIIVSSLTEIAPKTPILSEEGAAIDWNERRHWNDYWLIDPLDGTKEFINKNGEFTVNIAHIRNGEPVWGVVYVPTTGIIYTGGPELGSAVKINADKSKLTLKVTPVKAINTNWTIVGSRSHQSKEFNAFTGKFSSPHIKTIGSSLKICMVAEGTADIYPRLGLTSEWDTAAAHAVLLGAGGIVIDAEHKSPLKYNQKESTLNPFFIAANGISAIW